jgi:hypothetical protein
VKVVSDLDAMSERARNSYFFACATIGGEYAMPVLKASEAALDPPGGCDSERTDASASQDHPLARCQRRTRRRYADSETRSTGETRVRPLCVATPVAASLDW